jgi:hypothetical protein
MSVWPARGVPGAALRDALSVAHNGAGNIFSAGTDPSTVINSYLKWCVDAAQALRVPMRREDLRHLVLNDTYWAVQANPTPSQHLVALVHSEVAARKHELGTALSQLSQELRVWSAETPASNTAFVIPDTNVLLEHPTRFDELEWHHLLDGTVKRMNNLRLVIPLLVFDELDNAKSDRVRSRARQTLKVLYDFFRDDVAVKRRMQPETGQHQAVDVQILMDPDHHTARPRRRRAGRPRRRAAVLPRSTGALRYQ